MIIIEVEMEGYNDVSMRLWTVLDHKPATQPRIVVESLTLAVSDNNRDSQIEEKDNTSDIPSTSSTSSSICSNTSRSEPLIDTQTTSWKGKIKKAVNGLERMSKVMEKEVKMQNRVKRLI